jgi:MFS family permease
MSDSQYGFLSGPVFTIVTMLSMFVTSYFVDRANRKFLLLIFGVLWNAVCLLIFFAQSYTQLLLIRIIFAALASMSPPACISLINDYFKNEYRARANSVYVMAVSFGVCFANMTSLINTNLGWRKAALIVSFSGIGMALLVIFLAEPRSDKHAKYLP